MWWEKKGWWWWWWSWWWFIKGFYSLEKVSISIPAEVKDNKSYGLKRNRLLQCDSVRGHVPQVHDLPLKVGRRQKAAEWSTGSCPSGGIWAILPLTRGVAVVWRAPQSAFRVPWLETNESLIMMKPELLVLSQLQFSLFSNIGEPCKHTVGFPILLAALLAGGNTAPHSPQGCDFGGITSLH